MIDLFINGNKLIIYFYQQNKVPVHLASNVPTNLSIHLFNPPKQPHINSVRNASRLPLIHLSDYKRKLTRWPSSKTDIMFLQEANTIRKTLVWAVVSKVSEFSKFSN